MIVAQPRASSEALAGLRAGGAEQGAGARDKGESVCHRIPRGGVRLRVWTGKMLHGKGGTLRWGRSRLPFVTIRARIFLLRGYLSILSVFGQPVSHIVVSAIASGGAPRIQDLLTLSGNPARMVALSRIPLPGQTRFFTLRLARGETDLLIREIETLRLAWRATVAAHATRCEAMVVLPDHLHAVLTLPPGPREALTRWRCFRDAFARTVRPDAPQTVWEPEILAQDLRDEAEVNRHLALCWQDPVRHGLVRTPEDWPYSSLHRDLRNAARRRAVA
ncbi:REP-associated tyrosine transposase [Rhodobacter xanthinilyticus]